LELLEDRNLSMQFTLGIFCWVAFLEAFLLDRPAPDCGTVEDPPTPEFPC
jgi:hypothetical protein